MKIKKRLFVEQVSDKTGLTVEQIDIAIKAIFDEIKEVVGNGHTIRFSRFGRFGSYIRSQRRIGSMKKGKTTEIKARRLPRFWVSKAWKKENDAGYGSGHRKGS